MASSSCQRALSVFKSSLRRWTPIYPGHGQLGQHLIPKPHSPLSLITWNIDGFSSRPVARARLLLNDILCGVEGTKRPDILFLQEVTTSVRSLILDHPTVRDAFLVTDAEDQTSFEGVPFANMTLLSKNRFDFSFDKVNSQIETNNPNTTAEFQPSMTAGPVSLIQLPSKYGRTALCVDITLKNPLNPTATGSTYRLINVHLDSLGDPLALQNRTAQLRLLANLLRAPGCSGGLIAGDFNAVSPDDHALLDENGLVDAWLHLHSGQHRTGPQSDSEGVQGGGGGATWGVGMKRRRDNLGLGRLDKVAILGMQAVKMEVLRPGFIEIPVPGQSSDFIPLSDHCGLEFTFSV